MNTLTKERFPWKAFIKSVMAIAVPVALQNLLTTTGSMVDTMMLAPLGELTVGAVGLCAQFSSLMFTGYWGFVGGGMLFFAQYWGAKDDDGIDRSYGITLSFMMLVAAVFASLALFLPEWGMKGYTDKGAELDGKGHLRLKLVLEDGTIKASQLQTGTNYHDAPRNLEPNPWGQAPIWGVGEQPKPTFMHRYGYWEIRCKFQKLPGWWSAFWIQSPSIGMAPNARYAGVEVDVMENFHRDGRTTSGSIYGGYGKGYRNGDDRIDYKVDPDRWHRFGLLWTPTNYVYYCDGREMARSSKMVSQVEQFLIVSCEVKGYREGKMDKCGEEIRKAAIRPDGTIIDDAFEVDYVRVFDTGFGCMKEVK